MRKESLYQYVEAIKEQNPRIHNITNMVTINDCANILLAVGASPIMADDIKEVEQVTSVCKGLNINIGTLQESKIPSMVVAGKTANQNQIPVVLDPVGLGASSFRQETVKKLLEQVQFSVIKGNMSEIKTLIKLVNEEAFMTQDIHGIDANTHDLMMPKDLYQILAPIKETAKRLKTTIIATGPLDMVTDGYRTAVIDNGHPLMEKVSGAGCMLSSLLTAFIGTESNEKPLEDMNKKKKPVHDIFYKAVSGVVTMGIAGQIAHNRLVNTGGGSGSYKTLLIDALDQMEERIWLRKSRISWICEEEGVKG